MTRYCALLLCALLVAALGCSHHESATKAVPLREVLVQGTQVLEPRNSTVVIAEGIEQPGELRATLTWPGMDGRVTAYFTNGSPDSRGWRMKRSPLTSKVEVTETDIEHGTDWSLHITNASCCRLVTVRYAVKFTPYE